MKLAKALKLKNRLAGEVTRLKETVKTHNSKDESQEMVYDVGKTFGDLLQAINKLVLVKTAIACANAGKTYPDEAAYKLTPYWAIFEMAELKGIIEMLRSTSTKNGQFTERERFGLGGDPSHTVVYRAEFKQAHIDEMVQEYEKIIDTLQDGLDIHNASSDLTVLNFA